MEDCGCNMEVSKAQALVVKYKIPKISIDWSIPPLDLPKKVVDVLTNPDSYMIFVPIICDGSTLTYKVWFVHNKTARCLKLDRSNSMPANSYAKFVVSEGNLYKEIKLKELLDNWFKFREQAKIDFENNITELFLEAGGYHV
jgi:hypothetical protein